MILIVLINNQIIVLHYVIDWIKKIERKEKYLGIANGFLVKTIV